MLREFEDQENLLAEMDEQVDAYRAAGKLEAALRLEDQLHLIHERFQELSMKFELFQQQPSVEYEPRLARVARQLRDIKEKVKTIHEILFLLLHKKEIELALLLVFLNATALGILFKDVNSTPCPRTDTLKILIW